MDDDDFVHTRKAFPDAEQFKLMRKKGIFPYYLITSIENILSKTPIFDVGMAWDCALKMTEVQLELITSEDQYLFLEVSKI